MGARSRLFIGVSRLALCLLLLGALACLPVVPPPGQFACRSGGPCDAGGDDAGVDAGAPAGEDGGVADGPPDASSDAGGTDATGIPSCAVTDAAIVCEDFEAPALNDALWTFGGSSNLVDNFSHSGSRSVCNAPLAPDGTNYRIAQLRTTTTAAPLAGRDRLYIRAWFFVAPPPDHGGNIKILRLDDNGVEQFSVTLFAGKTRVWNGVAGIGRENAGSPPVFGRWSCYELGVVFTGTTGFSLSRDDKVLIPFFQSASAGAQGIYKVALGAFIPPVQAQPPIAVWLDDVAIDVQPIGCSP